MSLFAISIIAVLACIAAAATILLFSALIGVGTCGEDE